MNDKPECKHDHNDPLIECCGAHGDHCCHESHTLESKAEEPSAAPDGSASDGVTSESSSSQMSAEAAAAEREKALALMARISQKRPIVRPKTATPCGIDGADVRRLNAANYELGSKRFDTAFVLLHRKSGKVVELWAASSVHACTLMKWNPKHVKLLKTKKRPLAAAEKVGLKADSLPDQIAGQIAGVIVPDAANAGGDYFEPSPSDSVSSK